MLSLSTMYQSDADIVNLSYNSVIIHLIMWLIYAILDELEFAET